MTPTNTPENTTDYEPIAKLVVYDKETKDFQLWLGNEFIGYAATISEGFRRLDALVYERLRRGAVAR